jgi:hypothetical protein
MKSADSTTSGIFMSHDLERDIIKVRFDNDFESLEFRTDV